METHTKQPPSRFPPFDHLLGHNHRTFYQHQAHQNFVCQEAVEPRAGLKVLAGRGALTLLLLCFTNLRALPREIYLHLSLLVVEQMIRRGEWKLLCGIHLECWGWKWESQCGKLTCNVYSWRGDFIPTSTTRK